jgi:hypothetical protein
MAAIAAIVASCGGGVGTGGTGSFAAGPITGFGSVIVNDIRFDDSSAQVEDGDGVSRTRDDLRLGMTVEIDSGAVASDTSGAVATAARIRYDSELLGPVGAVDVAAGTFTVLGQQVQTDATTVFAESVGGLAALAPAQMVEVYAVYDAAASRYRAKRVASAAAGDTAHLRGPVAQLDTAAHTLRIGTTPYAFDTASAVPAGLAAGQFVRLRLASPVPANGRWAVQAFGTAVPEVADADGATFRGLISSYTSIADFRVNGRAVDASAATLVNGSAAQLALGVRVQVQGSLRAGTLRATRVSIDSDMQDRMHEFELHGAIAALDLPNQTFLLRGLKVSTARPDLQYDSGSAADLATGRQVRVRGLLSGDGLRIEALSIKFE